MIKEKILLGLAEGSVKMMKGAIKLEEMALNYDINKVRKLKKSINNQFQEIIKHKNQLADMEENLVNQKMKCYNESKNIVKDAKFRPVMV